MNEKQKRFTVEKIEKYNEEILNENKNINNELFRGAITVLALCSCMISGNNWLQLASLIYSPALVWRIKNMNESLCNKAGLSNKIDLLNHLLDLSDMEENSKEMSK